jgi:hypothetical protein
MTRHRIFVPCKIIRDGSASVAMDNRPFWSSIWPEKLTRDKKNVLAKMGFEYDYSRDAFVHRQLKKVVSFDAVSDMKLDELDAFGQSIATEGEFRFRGGLAPGDLELLMKRYGWG